MNAQLGIVEQTANSVVVRLHSTTANPSGLIDDFSSEYSVTAVARVGAVENRLTLTARIEYAACSLA